MDNEDVLALFDRQMRETSPPDGPGARVERVGRVVRQTGPDPVWNGVLWSDLDEECADREIAEQVRHFASLGREFEWKLYAHDTPGDLGERLLAAGFTAEPAEALMVAESKDQTGAVALPEGVELVPVTDRAGVALMTAAHEQAFGQDSSLLARRMELQLAEAPDTLVAVVAMADGVPVSAARMELIPGTEFAGLWGGGTAEAWRGKGIYRALVSYRARVAAERGYRFLQVDASDRSAPILRRLGFARLSTTTPYVHQP
ncbi:GNAT family N-acetyltransferase [Streptomyces sp. TLI_146]|uniref:GNAT family N-acetyltransferase n=1 Tax=Streptomyces sp. TLI_146 TaxID=1938858 RepID=UPI000C709632|nr:GNAT family N-acetyltransferase [Streptomyces sp. TLI_146]PKV84019.1 acetyltransferase (GNAT) family protein [Streptomyces sp. TLI_146]